MAFNWREYLALAEALDQKGYGIIINLESLRRTVISRAYYSAFILSRNFIRDNWGVTIPSSGVNVHLFVIRELEKGDPVAKKVAQNLARMRRYRNMADYEDDLPGVDGIAKECLRLANYIANIL